ncbi:unnamed protein product, partial [Mesorhabditis belari]|uniref:Protein quiver n=1 Tax=Mesorhabditis belari TaxID=2138241 RepID=A0AAF3JAZ3_9BILA
MQSLTFLSLCALVSVSWAVQCWQCNSGAPGQDKCAATQVTDLDPKWKKDCGKLRDGEYANKPAKGCRKIEQYVGKESQVIRECAYSGEEVDGLKKTGNTGIQLYYYQCKGEGCNSSTLTSALTAFSVIAVALGLRY